MSTQKKSARKYDGSNPEGARNAYIELMTDWEDALKRANDPKSDVEACLRLADQRFEEAQSISRAYSHYHRNSVETGETEGSLPELLPPESWNPFSKTEDMNVQLYNHLLIHYPWVVGMNPSTQLKR